MGIFLRKLSAVALFILMGFGNLALAQFQFSSPIPTPVGITISSACICDVTGDLLPDFIAIDGGGTVSIARGIGEGVHGEVAIYDRGEGIDGLVRGIACGDLDADGDKDLVFTWSHPMDPGGFVSFLVFDNGIPSDRIDFVLDFQVNRTPFDLSLGDMNGDGRLDIVLCTSLLGESLQPSAVSVLIGVPSASMPDYFPPQHYPRSSLSREVELFDLDFDGDLDVVMACKEGNTLCCFENDGLGQLALAAEFLFPELPEPYSVAVGDYDANGIPDLLLGTWQTRSLIPFLGMGGLQYEQQNEIAVGQFGWGLMHRILLNDMNADGIQDVVIPFSSGVFAIRYGDGIGGFPEEDSFVTYQSAKNSWFHDLDNNGTLEFVMEHTDLKLFTTFFGGQELRGRLYVDPISLPTATVQQVAIRVSANLGIREADFGIEIDRVLMSPQALEPSDHVMDATAGAGPDLWLVDLGSSPQDPVTLSMILDFAGQAGLGAGIVRNLATLTVEVEPLAQDQETTLGFVANTPGGPFVTVTGGIPIPVSHDLTPVQLVVPTAFVRGDINQNGSGNVADAVVLLRRMFGIDLQGNCLATWDTDGEGGLDLSDVILLLRWLFAGGVEPAAPFPTCGVGADPLALPCEMHDYCP